MVEGEFLQELLPVVLVVLVVEVAQQILLDLILDLEILVVMIQVKEMMVVSEDQVVITVVAVVEAPAGMEVIGGYPLPLLEMVVSEHHHQLQELQ